MHKHPTPRLVLATVFGVAAAATTAQDTVDLDAFPNRRPHIELPPAWAFGVLYGGYDDQDGARERVERIIAGGLPIDAYWIDSSFWNLDGSGPGGYLDFVGDRDAYPDPGAFWGFLKDNGIKAGVWVWDRLLEDGNEAVFNDFVSRGFTDEPRVITERWHTDGRSRGAFVDFDDPEAARYWQERLRPLFDDGLDFLKIDAQARLSYMEAAFRATQAFGRESGGRGFILSHANTPDGDPRDGGDPRTWSFPTKWTGDAAVRWTQDTYPDLSSYALGGLREQVRLLATRSGQAGGHPFITGDAGGYSHAESSDEPNSGPDSELWTRWTQFAMFQPITVVFGAQDQARSNDPFEFSPEAVASFREHARLRARLFPYRYSYAHLSRLTEENSVRPAPYRDDQFFFGDALLVAPVVEPGATRRYVAFDGGRYYDWWTGEPVTDRAGGRWIDVRPGRLPLFVRGGAIVPLRPAARTIERGSNESLTVRYFPLGRAGRGEFLLIEDDGVSNDYLSGRFAVTRIRAFEDDTGSVRFHVEPVEGGYDRMPEERTLVFDVPGERVTVRFALSRGVVATLPASARAGGPADE
ncbi:MAG: TIM-barrel domain-containing protein [Planctomycetota bacterium]